MLNNISPPNNATPEDWRLFLYSDFEPITTFDRFAELCGADLGQLFTFRFTDPQAPYGLYWYEYNSSRTRSVTPSESQCLIWVEKYFKQHPHVQISPEWFDQDIDWHNI